ncbi:MAG: hypothetical protein PHW72_01740 [Candidatus Pacebacteria bacterium]|nr:hypothetical protein [Candidatus Paceibacterota bacterium]
MLKEIPRTTTISFGPSMAPIIYPSVSPETIKPTAPNPLEKLSPLVLELNWTRELRRFHIQRIVNGTIIIRASQYHCEVDGDS